MLSLAHWLVQHVVVVSLAMLWWVQRSASEASSGFSPGSSRLASRAVRACCASAVTLRLGPTGWSLQSGVSGCRLVIGLSLRGPPVSCSSVLLELLGCPVVLLLPLLVGCSTLGHLHSSIGRRFSGLAAGHQGRCLHVIGFHATRVHSQCLLPCFLPHEPTSYGAQGCVHVR